MKVCKAAIAAVVMFFSACLMGASAQAATPTLRTTNWAGYQIHADHLLTARATWRVPTVYWGGRSGYSAQWIGLGSGTSARDTLIQAGTEADDVCARSRAGRCTSSATRYWAWIDIYPAGHQERISNLVIHPGNIVTTSVTWNRRRHSATFILCNWSVNRCITATRRSNPPGPGAEIIMERPALTGLSPAPLANFTQWNVLGADFVTARDDRTITQMPHNTVRMMNPRALATPSALNTLTGAFSVAFHRAN